MGRPPKLNEFLVIDDLVKIKIKNTKNKLYYVLIDKEDIYYLNDYKLYIKTRSDGRYWGKVTVNNKSIKKYSKDKQTIIDFVINERAKHMPFSSDAREITT